MFRNGGLLGLLVAGTCVAGETSPQELAREVRDARLKVRDSVVISILDHPDSIQEIMYLIPYFADGHRSRVVAWPRPPQKRGTSPIEAGVSSSPTSSAAA